MSSSQEKFEMLLPVLEAPVSQFVLFVSLFCFFYSFSGNISASNSIRIGRVTCVAKYVHYSFAIFHAVDFSALARFWVVYQVMAMSIRVNLFVQGSNSTIAKYFPSLQPVSNRIQNC